MIALHSLHGTVDSIQDFSGTFNPVQYSQMKYGVRSSLVSYARALSAELLAQTTPDHGELIFPVAYHSTPPSCYYLAREMVKTLDGNGVPARIVKVNKSSVTALDYAASNAEDRAREMASIRFELNEDLSGKNVVLVDDIRVTGLAEKTITTAVLRQNPRSIRFAYIAEVDPVLARDSHVESVLNHYSIKSMTNLVPFIRADDFELTVRFTKFVLSSPPQDLVEFLSQVDTATIALILNSALEITATFDTLPENYARSISLLNEGFVKGTKSHGSI